MRHDHYEHVVAEYFRFKYEQKLQAIDEEYQRSDPKFIKEKSLVQIRKGKRKKLAIPKSKEPTLRPRDGNGQWVLNPTQTN